MKLVGINYKKMDNIITYISKENNVKKSKVYFDFFHNAIFRGVGYIDYLKGNYINLSDEEKKNYLTKRNYAKLIRYLNKHSYQVIFNDKIVFNRIFKDYIGRDFIDIREVGYKGFKKFVSNKEIVFAKKHISSQSKGIKINLEDEDLRVLFNQLYNNKQYLIEDTLIQHEYLDWINPKVVNNIRLVTLLKDDEVYVVFKTLRINVGNEETIDSHAIYTTLDDEGNILGNVIDDECNIYKKHPITGFKFKGVKIPNMDIALNLVKKTAKLVPEMRLIGWDVAITKDGAAIIGGNSYPNFDIHQFYLLNDGEDIGKYIRLKEILKDEI